VGMLSRTTTAQEAIDGVRDTKRERE